MNKRSIKVHTIESLNERCEEVGDCLEWQGYFQGNTPYVNHEGKCSSVRRIIFTLLKKQFDPTGHLGVKCNNNKCVNPDHIIARTLKGHMENMGKNVKYNHPVRIAKLQKVAQSRRKLSDEQIFEIRFNDKVNAEMAREMNVSKSLISKIRRNQSNRTVNASINPFAGLFR